MNPLSQGCPYETSQPTIAIIRPPVKSGSSLGIIAGARPYEGQGEGRYRAAA